jgi:hypothetical protein
MFFLTRERQEVFDAANAYPFEEEIDGEFEKLLYENLVQYIDVLPQKFQSQIIERALLRNDTSMDEFKEWCKETIEQFITKSNAIYEKRDSIVERFHPSAQNLFLQSFHDGEIINAGQQENEFTLLLDMRSGFTVESIVQLVFHDARTKGELEGNYVYDELIEIEEGFGLRVLSSFGSPYSEWTIYFKEVTANYLYRPAVYIEPGEIATWDEYVSELNPDNKYYILKDMGFVEIDLASLSQTENGIFAGRVSLGDTFKEARERIYCGSHEDPYAHFSELIPTDELIFAMFDPDQNLRVRAFNTIFAQGEEVAYIVNMALRKANASPDGDMYFDILASHFDQLGCLENDVKLKWLVK